MIPATEAFPSSRAAHTYITYVNTSTYFVIYLQRVLEARRESTCLVYLCVHFLSFRSAVFFFVAVCDDVASCTSLRKTRPLICVCGVDAGMCCAYECVAPTASASWFTPFKQVFLQENLAPLSDVDCVSGSNT